MRRYDVAGLLSLIAMPVIAIAVGTWLAAQRGWPVTQAIVQATLVGVFTPILLWAVYRMWARLWCGAPFLVGDSVRIAHGDHAGRVGRVTGVHQGLEVDVELLDQKGPLREAYSWGQLRRVRKSASD